MFIPAQLTSPLIVREINFSKSDIIFSQERKIQSISITELCNSIKSNTKYSIIIDGIVNNKEIEIDNNINSIENLYTICKKLNYKYYNIDKTILIFKSYQDPNNYPDISPDELATISNEISTILNSLWKQINKTTTISSLFREITLKLTNRELNLLDSDKGLTIKQLSPELQQHVTKAILYNEFGQIYKSWQKIHETFSSIEDSEISLQSLKEFDIIKLNTRTSTDSYPLYKNRNKNEQPLQKNKLLSLGTTITENNINNCKLLNNTGSHYASAFLQNNDTESLTTYSKYNNWQVLMTNNMQNIECRISRKPTININTSSNIGPAILDRMPVSMRDFIFSKSTSENTDQKPVNLTQKINIKLEELSFSIYQILKNNKTSISLKYKNLTEEEKKIISDYIFFFWLSQSKPNLSNLLSPTKFASEPLNTTMYRKKDSVGEIFTIMHPDFGLFSVRSRMVYTKPN